MNTQRYQLRLSGLRENEGQIKAASLRLVFRRRTPDGGASHPFAGYWRGQQEGAETEMARCKC